ncbi:VapA/VapB family virulence-associated protein [Gilvimarinus sp. DA14]|uniref:VapA/VapB family virulence-associated protein n=1 Tax=Gilvimarinus sp. DA14 TaxID=2956798 RepID=UPI0020B6E251|nr:VapA/VapB family virulence-associated protein [Gilvimarinus sp. DA14]UTF59329.1 VapA/VapB family virulence-associated protein [Gilvimarinus sp. DA14]
MSVLQKSPKQLAVDFQKYFTGMLDESSMRRTVQTLENTTENRLRTATPYDAEGSLSSLIYYVKASCNVEGGRAFSGRVWGQGLPTGGALVGDIFLADGCSIDDLYCRTCEFTYTATPSYTAFYFFDFNEMLLGHFQAGAISSVFSVGKGDGVWR